MYSQANVRAGKWPRPPPRALPSVIVDTEKVLREADGSVKLVEVRPHTDGKVFAPGAPQNRTVRAGRSPKNTSVPKLSTRSRSCSASFASIIAIQGSYTVYVDI